MKGLILCDFAFTESCDPRRPVAVQSLTSFAPHPNFPLAAS